MIISVAMIGMSRCQRGTEASKEGNNRQRGTIREILGSKVDKNPANEGFKTLIEMKWGKGASFFLSSFLTLQA